MKTIILDSTTKSLKAKLSVAPATTNPDFVASWADDSDTAFLEGSSDGTLNGSTEVTLVAAPAASTRRVIKSIAITNRDTAAVTLTVIYDNNGTQRILARVTLYVGDTWTNEGVYDATGRFKSVGEKGDTFTYADLTAEQKSELSQDDLKITARLAEFDTEQAKYDARENLGLNIIDGGTFN